MAIPADLHYYKDHSWVRIEGTKARVGITNYAQEALGDVVYLELPALNAVVKVDEEIGELESTKTTAPIIASVGGRVVEVNTTLKEHPECVNQDPYGRGWIAVIEMTHPAETEGLMTAAQYHEFVKEEEGEGKR